MFKKIMLLTVVAALITGCATNNAKQYMTAQEFGTVSKICFFDHSSKYSNSYVKDLLLTFLKDDGTKFRL
ncbi:MAG: hypothetical protein ACI4NE_01630 [Succinivibrio sp.]